MLGPFLPLIFVSPSWYRWLTDRIVATWLTLPVALLELLFGTKVVITGDGFVPGERSVIIMNHRTRLDWMFLWNCLLRYSYLRLEKICLKSSLKAVPGFEGRKILLHVGFLFSSRSVCFPYAKNSSRFSPVFSRIYARAVSWFVTLQLELFAFNGQMKSWAMQVAAFIFIRRKWEEDKSHFEAMLDYFCDIKEPLQLLIFPEGTDLTG
ncbi:unnamed protein product [Ranitomeya imitator]|uniref:Phospholipid/glycerol acyltransferase domain-containing protein n=1 Tax=Ranitomeya imitator TaxID=111125 RepID=A0ABN9KY02_9NEOB|nr:unnamed protein product [Ranitomeya imitator]